MTFTYRKFLILSFILGCSFLKSQTDSLPKKEKKVKVVGMALPSRTPENGWLVQGGLVSYFKTDNADTLLRKSNLYLFGLYSQLNQYRISIGGDIITPREKVHIYSWIYHSYLPEKFFGLRNIDFEQEGEFISYTINHLESEILFKTKRKWYSGLTLGLEQISEVEYVDSGLFDQQVGFEKGGYFLGVVGAKIKLDSRNDVIWPSEGWLFNLSLKQLFYFSETSNGGQLLHIDLRRYKILNKEKFRSVILGGYIDAAFGNIPFRYLPANTTRAGVRQKSC